MSTPPYRTVVVKLPVFIGPCVSASCCDTFSLCFLWTLPLSLFFMCQTHTLLVKHLLSAAAAAWSCCQDYHVSNRRKGFPLTRGSNTLASWLLALSLNSCADPFSASLTPSSTAGLMNAAGVRPHRCFCLCRWGPTLCCWWRSSRSTQWPRGTQTIIPPAPRSQLLWGLMSLVLCFMDRLSAQSVSNCAATFNL